jgi:hypothetical protein
VGAGGWLASSRTTHSALLTLLIAAACNKFLHAKRSYMQHVSAQQHHAHCICGLAYVASCLACAIEATAVHVALAGWRSVLAVADMCAAACQVMRHQHTVLVIFQQLLVALIVTCQ